jgi:hypothetical protein
MRGFMALRLSLKNLFRKTGLPTSTLRPAPKFDENYPDHINSRASKLKNSVEGLRDDSSDLQKKYEGAPLRRKARTKAPKRKPKKS